MQFRAISFSKALFCAASATALAVFTLRAQIVADGATNTLSNVTNTFTGDVTVGTNGSFTLLVLSNNALLTNSGFGVISRNATAKSNEVRLISASARWLMSSALVFGNDGSSATLVVSNGALVRSSYGRIGLFATSTNNLALVTGNGSTWTNANDLEVGISGSGNQLIVNQGGLVVNNYGVIGDASSNNVTLVSGAGSVWSNRAELFVGFSGSRNQLVVTNGGTVAASNMFVGFQSSSTNNRVVVDGGTLHVTNAAGNGTLDILRGTNVLNSGLVDVDRLVLTNQAGLFEFNGGTLITRSANISVVLGSILPIGTARGSVPAVWDVRGISNNLSLVFSDIGRDSSFNRMFITNGAVVTGGGVILGEFPTANSNVLVMAGAGSRWLMAGRCSLGGTGVCNRVEVNNSAALVTPQGLFISFDSASTNNEALVTGVGSAWTNTSELRLGFRGGGNRVAIGDGGLMVNADDAFIGFNPSSGNNELMVTGAGSVCSNLAELHVGESGSGNRAVVTNGAWLVNLAGAFVGFKLTSGNNELLVTGAGSVCSNLAELRVGEFGSGNRLVVSDGGTVFARDRVLLGANPDSTDNRIVVDGGTLRAINASTSATLDVGRGTNELNAGLIDVDWLVCTNSEGKFEFNGGTLFTGLGNISAGASFIVGDSGTVPAAWRLRGGDVPINSYLPDNSEIHGGTYLPTDYEPGDALQFPAPSLPYDTVLSTFVGTDANGDWSLYILDDTAGDAGSLSSWSLQIKTSTGVFTNLVSANNILIPSQGVASLYPSVLTAGGLPGTITNLTVTLSGLSHSYPDDLDVLLVGPGGQRVMLMSDAGFDINLVNATLVFDDGERVAAETTVSPPLIIGREAPGCQLLMTNSKAILVAGGGITVGANPASINNRVVISGGATLRATNASATATVEVRRGTNVLNAGLMEVDRLLLTSGAGYFEFNGGTLVPRATTNNNAHTFTVGNGVNSATLQLPGGTHSFANGLDIANHASLVGNGNILGTLMVQPGGTLAPSNTPSTFGTLGLSQTPVLQGTTVMRLRRNAALLEKDQIQTPFMLNYGGSLTITNIGTSALVLGDRFQFFSASAYAGAFSSLALPPLNAGLDWTNKLLVDGSIEVVVAQPKFTTISLSGTNVIITGTNGTFGNDYEVLMATNLALPLSNWVTLAIGQFGAGGGFSFTNGIGSGEPARFFRIRSP